MNSEELIIAIVVVVCFFIGICMGKPRQETGETCPICKGKGKFRSGQWGGFWDTCIHCKGKGTV